MRNRHGVRGPVLPQTVPIYKSRSDLFDAAVLEAYGPIARKFPQQLESIDVAVDLIPRMRFMEIYPEEVISDGPVPLGRVIPAGVDHRGKPTRARLVVFRQPIEQRCADSKERAELLAYVLTSLAATYLNVDPSVIDPDFERY